MFRTTLLFFLIVFAFPSGCHRVDTTHDEEQHQSDPRGDSAENNDNEGGATERDPNVDTGTNLDSDTDSGSDTENDTNADTDSHVGSESDADTDTNTDLPTLDFPCRPNEYTFKKIFSSPVAQRTRGIAEIGPNELLVIGDKTADIHHVTQNSTRKITTPYSGFFNGIWASSVDDILLAPAKVDESTSFAGPHLTRYANGSWEEIDLGVRGEVLTFHSLGPDLIYAVGTHGLFALLEGTTWNVIPLPDELSEMSNIAFSSVWAASPNDVYL